MPNYQDSKIYTVRSPNIDKYYLGSTTQLLCRRMSKHNMKETCSSKIIINAGEAYIELLENYPCNNKEELRKREGELIRLHKDNLVNINIAGRTKEETNKLRYERKKDDINKYNKLNYQNNKSSRQEKQNQYYQDNKDIILEKLKQSFNCECGSTCRSGEKARHQKTKKHLDYISQVEV